MTNAVARLCDACGLVKIMFGPTAIWYMQMYVVSCAQHRLDVCSRSSMRTVVGTDVLVFAEIGVRCIAQMRVYVFGGIKLECLW